MDRLFRKRTISTKEAHGLPIRSISSPVDPMWPEKATLRKKRKDKPNERRSESRSSSTTGEAPRVELNIRNSLMLPGLSQRFSVLLPSLTNVPADSLRGQLANQRQRGGAGPAITEEEEELLFAELRDIEAWRQSRHDMDMVSVSPTIPGEWDGRPPLSTSFSSGSLANWENDSRRYGGATSPISPMSGSSSTPNLLSAAIGRDRAGSPISPVSPPPTSTSFDSFATFGVHDTSDRGSGASIRTKSYGFSGGSGMRDNEYLRRIKKSTSNRNISGSSRSISIRSDDSDETARKNTVPRLPPIMTDLRDLRHPQPARRGRGGSPDGSDRTATPLTGLDTAPGSSLARLHHSPSSSLSLSLGSPPLHPAPLSPLPPTPPTDPTLPLISAPSASRGHRKSMLQGLSQSQMKRISAALLEIGYGMDAGPRKNFLRQDSHDEAYEETLEQEDEQPRASTSTRPSAESARRRYDSNAKSERSAHSAGSSSIFPYHVSPTTSSFAAAVQPPSEPSSPPGIAAVPVRARDYGLQQARHEPPAMPRHQSSASVSSTTQRLVLTEAARPVPVLTPTKSLPVRHNANASIDSAGSSASPVPGYIPGQPRPIGSVRSDGNSSRSGTPTNATRATDPVSPSRGRSGSSPTPTRPPPVNPRTTSLVTSSSVQQNGQSSRSNPSTASIVSGAARDAASSPASLALAEPIWTGSNRVNSAIAVHSHEGVIDEGDETGSSSHDYSAEDARDLPIRTVPSRRSVARSHSDSVASASPNSADLATLPMSLPTAPHDVSRAASQQGFIDAYSLSDQAHSRHASMTATNPVTPTQPLRNMTSMESVGSDYQPSKGRTFAIDGDGDDNGEWSPGEMIMTPEEDTSGELKLLCGFEKAEFRQMQIRLINKARAEREALRGEAHRPFSPIQDPIKPLALDLQALRAASPPTKAYRATTPDITETRPTPTSPVFLGNVYTPPPPPSHAFPVGDRRAAPAPPAAPSPPIQTPSEQHDEIATPPSGSISRQPSQKVQITPSTEDDPEKVRDFEARIAAATAALNRISPTSGGGAGVGYKLERKGTRKASNGAMVISTPKLLSSSVNLATQRLESPESVDSHTTKALENASGSSKKMSLRWRKLGFGRKSANQSISSNADVYSPPSSTSGSPNPQRLEDPILLGNAPAVPPVPRSAPLPKSSNDLNGFKFPSQSATVVPIGNGQDRRPVVTSPPGTSISDARQNMNGASGRRTPTGGLLPAPSAPVQPLSAPAQLPNGPATSRHVATASDDSVAKFIAAGRAVGLNDTQLNEMLIANGMVKPGRSLGPATPTDTGSASAPPASGARPLNQTSSIPVKVAMKEPVVVVEEKKDKASGGGLFRALSRKKSKSELKSAKTPASTSTSASGPAKPADTTESRNKVVRRTLLLPDGLPTTPQPYLSPNFSLDSPTGLTRKPSSRRKPVNMTEEDERLVASPSKLHSSLSHTSSNLSSVLDGTSADGSQEPAGLGFLQPSLGTAGTVSPSGREREDSATSGGSVYEYYGEDGEGPNGQGKKGIEIMEYEDGRVVWGVIDALRDDGADDGDYTQTALHSRQTSNASSHLLTEARDSPRLGAGWRGPVAPLNLRHRDRGPAVARPETNLYFTSPTDIGDLIDQLSLDPTGNKGRIDFLPPSPNPETPNFSQHLLSPATPSAPGQFEDPPSPRKSPPPPISIGRTNNIPAGGFSPKRQKNMRQNFGRSAGSTGLPASTSALASASAASPSSASFASSQSGTKPVEDRLQALMDRLISSGATRKV